MEYPPNFYRLTSLQIGNVRGYPSSSYLYSAPESKKLLILVDHRPSSENEGSTRTDPDQSEILSGNHNQRSAIGASQIFQKSCAVFNAAKSRTKHLLAVDDLGKRRRGILVLEVAWKDVCGMKYQNDLLTDASFALEAKFMEQWEFDGPDRASRYVSSWWIISSGRTDSSESVPKEDGDEQESSSGTDDRRRSRRCETSSAAGIGSPFLGNLLPVVSPVLALLPPLAASSGADNPRADLVHLLRHRILRSVQEHPLMKADLSRISGFLCLWMEACGRIISQNFEKAVMWFLRMGKLLAEPLAVGGFGMFLAPLWRKCAGTAELMSTVLSYAIASLYQLIGVLINWPWEIISSSMGKTAALIRLAFTAACEFILPKLRIWGPFFGWLEAGEVFRFPYLGTMLLIQNFEKAVRWFLGTARLLAETLAAAGVGKLLGCVRKICAGTAEVISWSPSPIHFSTSTSIEVALTSAWEVLLPRFQLVLSSLKLVVSEARASLPDLRNLWDSWRLLLKLLPSFSGGGRGSSSRITIWTDLRREFLSFQVLLYKP
ncbi:unnamed protein product [Spirodela intermedia]|uniref:Uncharacterized protein n=1 Tax=Spirodela intermedia TaxID=51605 RepID=A0A7I8IPR9_SPIIN|nr:unnamed protein product [Spirodela intermedia]CAA6659898.1 unnamed protein product [Spirodela intermedia]